jgi:signal transduction histidine kinase
MMSMRGGPRMRVGGLRIRGRLLVAFLGLALGLGVGTTLLIEAQARASLEGELAARLEAVAAAASTQIDPSLVAATFSLGAGPDSGVRTRARLVERLLQLKEATGVRRIYLLDLEGRDQLDTDPRAVPGSELPQARVHRRMLDRAAEGKPVSSPLFRDPDGELRKTGYAPLVVRGQVLGFVGIEADAAFLREIGALRRRILLVGAIGFALAAVLSVGLARGLTRPIGELVDAARAMGSGDLDRPIPVGRPDEVGFLARTLEEARGRLAERDRTLRAMVAGIAHEVRNPLGGIQIYAELLENDASLTGWQRERVRKVLREIRRLGEIVEEFLAYARPQAPERQTFDPDGIVGETIDLLAGVIEERGVGVSLHRPGQPTQVIADPGQVRQILLNLVRNALDASPRGTTVSVGWEEQGPTVVLWVEDRGPGIPPEQRERVFEPFYTTKAEGAGLGLSIVRHLTEQNGGRISHERPHGGGCRFTVRLETPKGGSRVG